MSIWHVQDTITKKINSADKNIRSKVNNLKATLNSPSDSVNTRVAKLKKLLQQKLDSLREKGQPTAALQRKIDSIGTTSNLSQDQYKKLEQLELQLKDSIKAKIPGFNSINEAGNKAQHGINEVNEVSSKIGIGPLGKDIKPDIKTSLPGQTNLPDLPASPGIKTDLPDVSNASGKIPDVTTKVPGIGNTDALKKDIPSVNTKGLLPDEVAKAKDKIGEISNTVKQAGSIVKEGEQYVKEVKTIREEGLSHAEKIPELAEQQLLKIDEVKAVQQMQSATTGKMEEYKKLIEQYKDEKAIKADLEKRSKELANDVIAKNQGKVDASMKKIAKAKRKFSEVPDARNLPKRVPNALKSLGWRERLVPGFTLYTFSSDRLWLQIDPQIYYKINGHLSLGAGTMYRFSMNPGKITFHDLKNLYGYKLFAQYHAFKGFALRAEAQEGAWKPWYLKSSDPDRVDKVLVGAVGICKNYNITKRVRGNSQILYHFSTGTSDPYKQKIIIRIGFDFSVRKKDVKEWQRKLKELK